MGKYVIDLMPYEKVLCDTVFGVVTTERVIFSSGMNFWRGGTRTDVPIKHITSVGHDVKKSALKGIGIILFWVLLILFVTAIAGPLVIILLLIAVFRIAKGIYLIKGYPTITLNTSGQDKNKMVGKPKEKKDGEIFTTELRNVLFKKEE